MYKPDAVDNHGRRSRAVKYLAVFTLLAIIIGGGLYYWKNKAAIDANRDIRRTIELQSLGTSLKNELNSGEISREEYFSRMQSIQDELGRIVDRNKDPSGK